MTRLITERQETILESVVQNYIKLARPVSSKFLKEEEEFDLSPATLRAEMFYLTKRGYLEQPYTSGGRIPTDKGYKFFVTKLMKKKKSIPQRIREILSFFKRKKRRLDTSDFENLAEEISKSSRVFVSFYFPEKRIHLKHGWYYLRKEPEAEKSDFWKELTQLIEDIDILIKKIEKTRDFPQIMIGRDIPLKKTENLSWLVTPVKFPKEFGYFYLTGPKRMIYERNLAIMEALIDFFNYDHQ